MGPRVLVSVVSAARSFDRQHEPRIVTGAGRDLHRKFVPAEMPLIGEVPYACFTVD
jgi:hypothetical protein